MRIGGSIKLNEQNLEYTFFLIIYAYIWGGIV